MSAIPQIKVEIDAGYDDPNTEIRAIDLSSQNKEITSTNSSTEVFVKIEPCDMVMEIKSEPPDDGDDAEEHIESVWFLCESCSVSWALSPKNMDFGMTMVVKTEIIKKEENAKETVSNPKPKRRRRNNKLDIVELIVDKGLFVCGICKKAFRIKGYAVRHIESHKILNEADTSVVEMHQRSRQSAELPQIKHNKFSCPKCEKYFKEHSYLIKHLNLNKCKTPDNLICKLCDTQFETYSQFKSHLMNHEPKDSACDICNEKFRFKNDLVKHYTSKHNNPRPFKCKLCEKSFAQLTHLSKHLISHSTDRPYACQKCGKRFKHKQNVVKHLVTHKREVKLICDVCKKEFPRESRLRYHMRSHNKERPFMCDLCRKKFSHKNNVIRHIMYKHPETLQRDFLKEFKEKIKFWDKKRNYSKAVMDSLKYCIYTGDRDESNEVITSDLN